MTWHKIQWEGEGERNRKGKGSWSEDHCLDHGHSICRDTQENLSSYNSPAWPVKGGLYKRNMAVAPIAMAVPDMMHSYRPKALGVWWWKL